MLKSETRTFDTGRGPLEFTVTQLPAMRSGKLLMRIGKSFGPALAGLLGSVDRGAAGLDFKSPEALPALARDLFNNLTGDELEALTRELFETVQVTVEGNRVGAMQHFELLFAGKIASWFGLLWFALGVNYGDFFGALAAVARPYMPKAAAANASTGSSTFSGPPNA